MRLPLLSPLCSLEVLAPTPDEKPEFSTPSYFMMIFAAGVVLLTPGLVTDTIGFLFLIPIFRNEIRVWIRRWIEKKIASGDIKVQTNFTTNIHIDRSSPGEQRFPDEHP